MITLTDRDILDLIEKETVLKSRSIEELFKIINKIISLDFKMFKKEIDFLHREGYLERTLNSEICVIVKETSEDLNENYKYYL